MAQEPLRHRGDSRQSFPLQVHRDGGWMTETIFELELSAVAVLDTLRRENAGPWRVVAVSEKLIACTKEADGL